MDKRRAGVAFTLICLLCAAAFAVLTLLAGVELAAVSDSVSELRGELRGLTEENERLRVRAACATDLEQLEAYAENELGMQHCLPGQVRVIRELG